MKVFWKIMAALAAIAAVAAALYCFRDKLKALFGCECACGKVDFVEQPEEEPAQEEETEEVVQVEAPAEEISAEEVTPADFAE